LKKIHIEGVIGLDVNNSIIRNLLAEANNDEITIEISSPGGFVYEGLSIFNSIRDYSRNNNKVTTKLVGLAASMASYIAMAGDRVIAEDNAVFMIHNVVGCICGDYRDMEKAANYIESLTNLLASAYAEKTGKSKKKIRELMDDETFFFGEEAKKEGFVDEIIENEENAENNKDLNVALAKERIEHCFNSIKNSKKSKSDLEKSVALISNELQNDIDNPKNTLNNIINDDDLKKQETTKIKESKKEGKKHMNLDELKKEHSELYNQVFELGQKSIQDNIEAHAEWFDVAPDIVINAIKNNEKFSAKHTSKYAKAELNNKDIKNRQEDDDNIGNINLPQNQNNDEAALNAFDKALKGQTYEAMEVENV
jgi:ATP-dependent Clp endopeptidase proteolytic subunit ClpP